MPRILIVSTILTCGLFLIGPVLPQTPLPVLPKKAAPQPAVKAQPKTLPQAPASAKVQPKLEPIAETRLLMEGLAHANFRGIERLLQQKPTDPQAWTFARGQALLIAETGNLLMLRPPKSQGQPVWFDRATELRSAAQDLAKTIAVQDYEKSRAGLISMAGTCNKCHQAFRVPVEISPFTEKIILEQ